MSGRRAAPRGIARGPLVAAAGLAALAALPFLGLPNYILQIANSAGIAVIFAISLNLLFGYCGQISFGHAGFYAIGSYAVALLAPATGFVAALGLAMLCAAGLALLIGVPLLRLRGHYLALGTLAFGMAVQVLALQWVDLTGGPWGLSIDPPTILWRTLGRYYSLLILACAVIAFWLSLNLVRSRLGRAMQIIREDEAVAKSLGVNTVLMKVSVFALSAGFAALAGGLYSGQNLYVTPALFDVRLSIAVLVMVVLGGAGTLAGPVIGAVLLTILPELLHGFEEYHVLIYGLVLLLVLRFMPRGLAGLASRLLGGRKAEESHAYSAP